MKRKLWMMCIIVSVSVLGMWGCKDTADSAAQPSAGESASALEEENSMESAPDSAAIAELYRPIYEEASAAGALESLETTKAIVQALGEAGYAAVDNDNQVDMVHPDQVISFIEQVNQKKSASQTVLSVLSGGGFIRYDLKTMDGQVYVTASSLLWDNKVPKVNYEQEYMADTWAYTENGYLFFDQYHMPGICWGHTALRVKALDETCRELNRNYILPVGYYRNNLFLSDWSRDDYRDLDFYDLYDILYTIEYSTYVPYEAADDGTTYEIPKDEFQSVIMSHMDISEQSLQSECNYNSNRQTYEYRPRGVYDNGSGEEAPYPEVVSYVINPDETMTLTVRAVWAEEHRDHVFSHEVVIRILEDGGYQYVSNRVIPSEDFLEAGWYVERMSEEEPEEVAP